MTILWELLLLVSALFVVVKRTSVNELVSLVLVVSLLYYVLPYYSNLMFSFVVASSFLSVDGLAFWLSYLVLVIVFASLFVVPRATAIFSFMMFLLFISCYLVFSASDLLTLYVAYEFSLIPILYIILNGGDYPDRSLSASYMLVYTSVFSFPFMVYVISSLVSSGSLFFSLYSFYTWGVSPCVVILAYFTFLVKLPVYGLHYWLPIAHVEAPTYGSMILAGLLLKMGGCGLFRIGVFTSGLVLTPYFIGYLLFAMVFSSVICCVQSDFKRLVAYSSVAHMMVVILAVILSSNLSIAAFTIIIITHGISSPFLFILVGLLYRMYGTRMLVLYRGIITSISVLGVFLVMCFILSVPVPPSLAFLGEVQFAISIIYSYWVSAFIVGIFVFLGVVYNLLWLGSLFGPQDFSYFANSSFSLTLRDKSIMLVFVVQSLLILVLLI